VAREIRLQNGMSIHTFPCTKSSLRGWSMPAAVMDEVAFFRLEGSAESDVEVQTSIRRGMLNFPNPRLVKISTPYMKSGVLYDDFKAAWGCDDPDRLVWRAPTALMNPSILEERLAREKRLDPERFSREYLAEFAEDLESFLPSAWVDSAIVPGRHELPPMENVTYTAGADPSGAGKDAFTLCVVHREGDKQTGRYVEDVLKSWRSERGDKIDLEGVVAEIVRILNAYNIKVVNGDRYSAGWVVQAFDRHRIRYEHSQFDRSSAYVETEPLFAQGRIDLLDHKAST